MNSILFYLDSGTTDHIRVCNTKELYSTFEAKQQTFTVPGGTTTTEGIGTIILHLQNFHTGNVDQLVLNNVAYMPLSKNLISTGELNKMNLHIYTEHNTLYSTHQQKGYVIEPAYNLLALPCKINNTMVHININYAIHKRKAADSALLSAQMLTRRNAFLQEPECREHINLDTGRFEELHNKFGPFEVKLCASKTNSLLPSHDTKENDCYSTEWMRLAFDCNPINANDDIHRALDKAVSEFQKAPETTKFMFVLPKLETPN